MKLNLDDVPKDLLRSGSPEPGDVYRKAGGAGGFWLVISARPNGDCYVLAFDLTGDLTGTSRYGAHYFAGNESRRVGRCSLPDLFNVEWFDGLKDKA